MNLNQKITLDQSQKLVITTTIKQSINILNMSKLELEDEIIKQCEENPIIDIERNNQIDWESYIKDLSNSDYKFKYNYIENNEVNFENLIKGDENIYDNLLSQLSLYVLGDIERKVCEFIINSLDEDGYLNIDDKEVINHLCIDKDIYYECLNKVQQLEPSGVGARCLSECLSIQIRNRGINDIILENILDKDLELIANNKYKDLIKKYDISFSKCIEYIDLIKSLNPKPGRLYSLERSIYIQPDVIVENIDGSLVLYSNDKDIPRIKINNFYKEIIKSSESDEECKKFVKENLNSAMGLVKSIESRKSTILKIAQEIINSQEDFFRKGSKYIKAMKMKDIAEKLNFHESTISRGVNGKYMLTPFGLFEFRYFFNSSIKNEDYSSTSSISIKKTIEEMVKNENKSKPLSDEQISNILREKGINIARRTVAKYREELNILSSSKRKHHFIAKK